MIHDSHLPVLLHILGGGLGIGSGTAAMVFRKGSRYHVLTGNVFCAAMLLMSGMGALMAWLGTEVQPANAGNMLGGIFTFYLITTAWVAARSRRGILLPINLPALAVIVAAVATYAVCGIEALQSPDGLHAGYPAALYFIFGSLALLAALLDVRVLWRGGVEGAQRIARHLWRMCFGLWIAVGSFFLGQPQVFPDWLKKSGLLFVPTLVVTLFLFYWLIRVLFTRAYKSAPRPTTSAKPRVLSLQG